MSGYSGTVVGVDGCPVGWLATEIDADGVRMETYEKFEELDNVYKEADRILVDIPIGLGEDERRACDEDARDLLGSRGLSVFYPPSQSAVKIPDYERAKKEHHNRIGHGLSQQGHSIAHKIQEVADVVEKEYDGRVRESHPELCFAALNGQPIAYSKSSDRGRGLRMKVLSDELEDAEDQYEKVRNNYLVKEVRRDDILDSMVLALAARNDCLATVPTNPSLDEPRIYYPNFVTPILTKQGLPLQYR